MVGLVGNIILFGDLLQLPPVRENSPYIELSSAEVTKFIGSMGNFNLWQNLFTYDELTINMRQKNDITYSKILSRVCLGFLTQNDLLQLQSKLIKLEEKIAMEN